MKGRHPMNYSTQLKPAAIRKLVIRGQAVNYQPAPLFVNEHDGEMWASNRYWVVRAAKIEPLLAEYNLSAAEPGLYGVDGKVSRVDNTVPNLAATPMDVKDYPIPGSRVSIAGQDVYALDSGQRPMAVYQLASGIHAGLLAGELEWLADARDVTVPEGHTLGIGTRLMFQVTQVSSGDHVSAVILADMLRVIEPSFYGTDPETKQHVNRRAVTEPAGSVVVAVVMAAKYGV